MDMSVFFASIDEKIQISMHTTHSGIKSSTRNFEKTFAKPII